MKNHTLLFVGCDGGIEYPVKGATFPKMVLSSTPTLKGFSMIGERAGQADARFRYAIPCPLCGDFHALSWGGKDMLTGFKSIGNDPDTVRHLCPHCGGLIDQGQYLAVWDFGRWQTDDAGLFIGHDGIFTTTGGQVVAAPRHVAFHV